MEDKLVTVAIHTYEKAQILKHLLENEGIETYIHNVNLIQPVVSAGVRVRIKESDLPKALAIIEEVNKLYERDLEKKQGKQNKILVPVDFSDYSYRACEMAFHFAAKMNDSEITIMHTYFSGLYSSIPVGNAFNYETTDEETVIKIIKKVHADIEGLSKQLKEKIKNEILPSVPFFTILKEGIPEEEILKFSKEYEPSLIMMGTRGKNHKELDLIGSVTAEIIDRSIFPLFAIPEDVQYKDFTKIKNIAYATSFEQKDLIAFQKMMDFLSPFNVIIHFIHISQDNDAWSEIKLAGIKEYFKKNYPTLETEYHLIQGTDVLESLDNFIAQNKIDVIALNTHKRNIFSRLFNPSFARKMIFHAKTPMLIFHA